MVLHFYPVFFHIHSDVTSLIELTKVLKLLSIPVALEEKSWTQKFPISTNSKAKRVGKRLVQVEKRPILSTQVTRSGRQVVHKKFDADEVTDFIEIPEKEHQVRHVEMETDPLLSDLEPQPAEQQLDNLLSVAESFEKTCPQVEVTDVSNNVIDGTDTMALVRECCLCHKRMLGRNALGRHMKKIHPASLGPYKCPLFDSCGKHLESGAKLLKHMYRHDRHNRVSKVTLETRLKEDMNSRLACNIMSDHPEIICSQSFSTATKFIEHMKKVHGSKPWICTQCPKRFQERQNFQYHLMTHDGKRGFVCDICSKSFSNPRQLYSHRSLHLGKRYLCPHCGFRARSTANLRGHIKTKHEEKSFECQVCSKKFSTNSNLKNHLRIHTGETPYQCILCHAKFKRLHHLNSHLDSKVHKDTLAKCKRKGVDIPARLDPAKRSRGKTIEDDQNTEPIFIDNFDNMVVLDDQSYVMLDGQTVEIVQASVNIVSASAAQSENISVSDE